MNEATANNPDRTLVVPDQDSLVEQMTAMNEALLVSLVRQHELTAAAEELNNQLQKEIAERKQAEENMRRANEELEQFATAASHDLQEPLRGVVCYTQLLAGKLRDHLDPEVEQLITDIVAANSRMLALIKDMLAYARVRNEWQPVTTRVDCAKAMEDALANLKAGIEETRAVVTSGPLPAVHADLAQLTQVFQNLIGNALKYRKSAGAPQIHISADFHGAEWILSVRDDGIGFDPQYSEQIFGIFKRLHRGQYPGTGVGLALCKRIVERTRGRIWATSESGKGATFFFTIPETQTKSEGASLSHQYENHGS